MKKSFRKVLSFVLVFCVMAGTVAVGAGEVDMATLKEVDELLVSQ